MTWTFTKRPGHLPNDLDILSPRSW